jgi:hypothetical protein
MVMKIKAEIMFVYKTSVRVEGDYVWGGKNSKVNLEGMFTTIEWLTPDADRSRRPWRYSGAGLDPVSSDLPATFTRHRVSSPIRNGRAFLFSIPEGE